MRKDKRGIFISKLGRIYVEAFESWDHQAKAIATLGRIKSLDQARVWIDWTGG